MSSIAKNVSVGKNIRNYMPKKNCVYAEKKLEHFGIIWYNNSIEKFPAKKTFSMLILKHSQRSISMSIKPENEQNQKQV